MIGHIDFFGRQDNARRQTHVLVGYFAAAVVLIVLALNIIGSFVYRVAVLSSDPNGADRHQRVSRSVAPPVDPGFWNPPLFSAITLSTLAVIAGGSLFKIAQTASGGKAIAHLMGAQLVLPNTTDPSQKTLRNVVEEMSIASGVPVPAIYVLPAEKGINAFAAGFSPRDAVICVTQGCLTRLTRDELQGIIAHEFSHILNGDTRLDLRLLGVLYGILLMGLIGYGLMRTMASASDSDDKNLALEIGLMILGAVIMAVGFIGLFFGRLIQAAVCRQREFLADAAAVQFTRNPSGLVGALKKLGTLGSGSRIADHDAEQVAHMFFASSMGIQSGSFATHPPLSARIHAIDPSWDGTFATREEPTLVQQYPGNAAAGITTAGAGVVAGAILGGIGSPRPQHVEWASDFLKAVPPDIDAALRDPFSARAVVFAMLLSEQSSVREKQMEALRSHADGPVLEAMSKLLGPITELGPRARRVLLDLSLPALRQLSAPQALQFHEQVQALIDADNNVTLFEFMLHRILSKDLPIPGTVARATPVTYAALSPLRADIATLLSALAAADGKDVVATQAAFAAGVARLGEAGTVFQDDVEVPAIDTALDRLCEAAPGVKRRIIDACAYCIAADGIVQTEEGELLRALTTALDCPLPPLLAHADVAHLQAVR